MASAAHSDVLASLSIADKAPTASASTSVPQTQSKPIQNSRQLKKDKKIQPKPQPKAGPNANMNEDGGGRKPGPKPTPSSSTKLRGMDRDSPEVRVSKTLSWLLRHGAQGEGLQMRTDGYVKVVDLLNHPKLKAQGLNLEGIKSIVKADSKQRYDLILENPQGVKLEMPTASSEAATSVALEVPQDAIWWIKARQGHSIKTVQLELKPITALSDLPTGIAIHGTNRPAWEAISKTGLSKMKRNHIHLAQGVAGNGVISGMRSSSSVLIYIDVQKALEGGIKFWLSDNGVVLTEGDANGLLSKKYFEKVVDSKGVEFTGWRDEVRS